MVRKSPRLARAAAAALLIVSSLTAAVLQAGPAAAASLTRYVFTAFTNSSESNMNVYSSSDGVNFTLLKASAYTPPSGLVRDPSLIYANGYYYIAYTVNWTGTTFGIARSTDLVNWTFVTNVDVGVSGTTSTWAPEWFVDSDGSYNLTVSLSPGDYTNFQPYKFTALNSTFTSWSSATALSGLSPNYIDTFIVRSGSTYHAFTKNETTKYVEHATASSLTGPYTFVGTGDWAGWGSYLEGPALVQLTSGTWRIFMDGYSAGKYYYADSSDLTTWSAKTEVPGGLSGVVRHGTVLKEAITTTTNTVVGAGSGRCLTAPAADGTQATIEDCASSTSQLWTNLNGRFLIGTRCLDAYGQGTANGTAVSTWTCNGGDNQQWTVRSDGSILGVQSGRCLDVTNAATAGGSKIELYDCNSGSNQRWTLN
jgi:hypothetical protein